MDKCDYIWDEELGMPDLWDCGTCKRERERTCPYDIYADTEFKFSMKYKTGKENGENGLRQNAEEKLF
jgi:hypothetical protein